MGHISANVTYLGDRSRRTVRNVLVDTGATYSVLDPRTMKALGVHEGPRRVRLELGNGRRIRAKGAAVGVRVGGREGLALVFTFRGARPVIGVETLEGLGLGVDFRRRRLVARRPSARALYYGTTTFGR